MAKPMIRKASAFFLGAFLACVGCSESSAVGGAGGSGAGGAGGVGGAEELEFALEVRGAVRPIADCSFSPELSPVLERGSWDVSSSNPYLLGLVVGNLLESRIVNELQGELNDIQVTSIDVTLRSGDAVLQLVQLPNPYQVVAGGRVPVDDGEGEALAVILAGAIPAAFGEALSDSRSEVTLELQVNGFLPDGTRVRAAPFSFDTDLCEGCLAEACAPSSEPAGSCTPGQDGDGWCAG